MKRIALAIGFLIWTVAASLAQNVSVIGPAPVAGNIPIFNSPTIIKDSGVAGGSALFANPAGAVGLTVVNGVASTAIRSDAAPPLSASVQSSLTQTNNQLLIGTGAFGFSSIVLGGDCTFTSPNITCTKTSGVAFSALATQVPGTGVAAALGNNLNASGGVISPTPTRAGDVIYWNGSTWVTLAGNNSGTQVLQETAAGVPSWTAAGAGSVTTPGAGLVSSVTAACSQAASQTTLSKAECVNAQSGTTYTFVDGDRAKLVTGTNAAAQAYTLPQAGAASAFQAGWYVDVTNTSTATAGIITITPTTSTIWNGSAAAASLILNPGQSVRIVSDGTNYQTVALPVVQRFTNSLGADVLLNNTANYFDGPSVAQGTLGTWLATGTVTLTDTAAAANTRCKLWDGTTVIASTEDDVNAASARVSMSLSGFLASPAANIRISCTDITSTSGKILFNQTGNSKDSTLTVMRIQ